MRHVIYSEEKAKLNTHTFYCRFSVCSLRRHAAFMYFVISLLCLGKFSLESCRSLSTSGLWNQPTSCASVIGSSYFLYGSFAAWSMILRKSGSSAAASSSVKFELGLSATVCILWYGLTEKFVFSVRLAFLSSFLIVSRQIAFWCTSFLASFSGLLDMVYARVCLLSYYSFFDDTR